jgi:tryptophan synthase beta chain
MLRERRTRTVSEAADELSVTAAWLRLIPAPEAAHAIHGAIGAARSADEAGEERTILFNLSGHGHFDMAAYDKYFAGGLEDVALDEAEMERALAAIEGLPTPA